jgi:hypothetical protein
MYRGIVILPLQRVELPPCLLVLKSLNTKWALMFTEILGE